MSISLYRFSLSKLPIDIFIDLSTSTSNTTSTSNLYCNNNNNENSNDDINTNQDSESMEMVQHRNNAQHLKYTILYKLKTTTMNRRYTTTATTATTTDGGINVSTSNTKRRRTSYETTCTNGNILLNRKENDINSSSINIGGGGIHTVGELLQQLSPYTLFYTLDPIVSLMECIHLYQRICVYCTPPIRIAYSMLPPKHKHNHVSTGWETFDTILLGGIRIGTITELVGGAGTGKTQFALQTTITSAMNALLYDIDDTTTGTGTGRGGGTIWIDTEQKVSLQRLQEMAFARCRGIQNQNNTNKNNNSCTNQVMSILENVTIHSPSNMNDLLQLLDSIENEIITRNEKANSVAIDVASTTNMLPVRLLVIDSIAAPVKREQSNWSAMKQTVCFMQIAQLLKRLADQYSLAILIINQITSSSSSIANSAVFNTLTVQHAALGTAWHHCVTTRIELQQQEQELVDVTNHNQQNDRYYQPVKRHAKIVKSLTVKPSYEPIPFQITVQGIVDVSENNKNSNHNHMRKYS
jgi:RecA/RadA recombinase